ncbi:MAG: YfbR-like 5'-deoxynucleotidase, partial [Rhodovibrionaceae bacterium]
GLARVARWNGQTSGAWAYSVAEHSLLVESLAAGADATLDRQWRLAALLHDAPEYVIGDLITPFKATVGSDYKALENRLQAAVHIRFGLPGELPVKIARAIKRADRLAAYLEATQLAGFAEKEAKRLFAPSAPPPQRRLEAVSPEEAKQRFLGRFAQLCES